MNRVVVRCGNPRAHSTEQSRRRHSCARLHDVLPIFPIIFFVNSFPGKRIMSSQKGWGPKVAYAKAVWIGSGETPTISMTAFNLVDWLLLSRFGCRIFAISPETRLRPKVTTEDSVIRVLWDPCAPESPDGPNEEAWSGCRNNSNASWRKSRERICLLSFAIFQSVNDTLLLH